MKRKLSIISSFLLNINLLAIGNNVESPTNESNLRMFFQDGSSSTYFLSEGTHISFTNEEILFENKKINIQIPLKTVVKWTFENSNSSVEQMPSNVLNWSFSKSNNKIVIYGSGINLYIAIYSLDGTLIYRDTAHEYAVVDLTDWTKGTYIAKVNSNVYKFIKF